MITIVEEISKLRKEIEYHDDLYYNQDSPEISDTEYDALTQQLKDLEAAHPELITKDSPTQHVGGKRTMGIAVQHTIPMLSLEDKFSQEEIFEFISSIKV